MLGCMYLFILEVLLFLNIYPGVELLGHSTSLVAQLVKNLPEMQETLVLFLGQKDPLEKG